jgi:hypothetical protein
VVNKKKPESVHMACKDVGRLCVGASQFGTASRQVFELPASVATSATDVAQTGTMRDVSDPFYASRPDVAGKRRMLDTTPFAETAIPLTQIDTAMFAEEPIRQRRIVVMKKRG